MAKAKRTQHRKKGFTLPLAALAGFVSLALKGKADLEAGGLQYLGRGLCLRTTGINVDDGKWYPHYLMEGIGPIIMGNLIHKLASKVGINRMIANAGIPILRI